MHAWPLVEVPCATAEDLVAFIAMAQALRATHATGVHDASSRSHAVASIYVSHRRTPAAGQAGRKSNLPAGAYGEDRVCAAAADATAESVLPVEIFAETFFSDRNALLAQCTATARILIPAECSPRFRARTLVDLAGSEQSIDSMHHDADRRKEGAQINSSLMALKDCIRARHADHKRARRGSRPGDGAGNSGAAARAEAAAQLKRGGLYRRSKLTLLLKRSLASPDARTVVITTASPSSKDTEHSLNTIRHACLMDGQDTGKETRFVTGGTTTREQLGAIDVTGISRKLRAQQKRGDRGGGGGGNGNGGGGSFGSAALDSTFNASPRSKKRLADKEKARARRAAERAALRKLAPAQLKALQAARASLGRGPNNAQQARLQRAVRAADALNAAAHAAGKSKPSLPK